MDWRKLKLNNIGRIKKRVDLLRTSHFNFKFKRGHRVPYKRHQTTELENEFILNQYPERGRRLSIAKSLRLSERQVKIWFQNRRMKWKKDRMRAGLSVPTLSPSHNASSTTPTTTANSNSIVVPSGYSSSNDSTNGATAAAAAAAVATAFPFLNAIVNLSTKSGTDVAPLDLVCKTEQNSLH